jgi:hypothetical protein
MLMSRIIHQIRAYRFFSRNSIQNDLYGDATDA